MMELTNTIDSFLKAQESTLSKLPEEVAQNVVTQMREYAEAELASKGDFDCVDAMVVFNWEIEWMTEQFAATE